jgi:hypothetical protein
MKQIYKKQIVLSKWYEVLPEKGAVHTENVGELAQNIRIQLRNVHLVEY